MPMILRDELSKQSLLYFFLYDMVNVPYRPLRNILSPLLKPAAQAKSIRRYEMTRWMLILFTGLMILAPALVQANSVLIPNEPVAVKKESLLESVFWKNDRSSSLQAKEYGYEGESAPYGYPHEEYGFRPGDEYGAEQDGQYGYEGNVDKAESGSHNFSL